MFPCMIHALPGMGADHRSFPEPWTELPAFQAHDWIRYSGQVSIRDVAGSAVLQWEGLPPTSTKIFRIHGRRDLVIPTPPIVDMLLDGGHLISMTHAAECTAFIRAKLTGHPPVHHPGC